MIVNDIRLDWYSFNAILLNESAVSYSQSTKETRELVPETVRANTVVLDCSLARYDVIREYYPQVDVVFVDFMVIET